MRLNRIALLIAGTAVAVSGCSAARSLSSAPQVSDASEATYSEYDRDPPQDRSRIALQPSPVPPAQGISRVRGISFLKILESSSQNCGDECADDVDCAAPLIVHPTAPECGDACVPKRSFWKSICDLPKKFRRPSCGDEAGCVETSTDSCSSDTACGERGCYQDRGAGRIFCPTPKSACVPEARCNESYCHPPTSTDCCESEGCSDRPSCCSRLLNRLKAGLMYRPTVRSSAECGDFCAAGPGCGDCDTAGSACSDFAANHCRPCSPLADPFVEPEPHPVTPAPEPQPAPGKVPNVPSGIDVTPDGTQSRHERGQMTPVYSGFNRHATRLNPVPGTPHTFVNPEIWPRLKAEEAVEPALQEKEPRKPARVASQSGVVHTHPTGWIAR
ncbi:MAG: hypothetical protein RIK87_05415 [Fuerstiella sp.]